MVVLLDAASLGTNDPPDSSPISVAHHIRTGRPGRPRLEVNTEFLREARGLRSITDIARAVGCNARTITRRLVDIGIHSTGPAPFRQEIQEDGSRVFHRQPLPATAPSLTNEQLDGYMNDIIERYPNFGRAMIAGMLRAVGQRVSRKRIAASYIRVHGTSRIFGDRTIHRREYKVAGPNSLWHHDGQHG